MLQMPRRSNDPSNDNFHEVVKPMLSFSIGFIKPKYTTFTNISIEIIEDNRYMPYFKVIYMYFIIILSSYVKYK